MKINWFHEINAAITTFLIIGCLIFMGYSVYWILNIGWAMYYGAISRWVVLLLGAAGFAVIFNIVRKKFYKQ